MTMLLNHETPTSAFLAAFASGRMPHAWLLTGPQGLGKASFAMAAALSLLDWKPGSRLPARLDMAQDTAAAKLVASDAHPEFHLLERPPRKEQLPRIKDLVRAAWPDDLERAGNIPIDQVRALIGKLTLKPAISHYRVIIIDAIDDMERNAANALLKILEEPPAQTIFLCVSHAPDRLLPTIRSRCRVLRFAPLDVAQMDAFLTTTFPAMSDAHKMAVVAMAEGSPGRAVAQSAQDFGSIQDILMRIAKTGDADNVLRGQLARMISGKGARDTYFAVLDAAPALAAQIARTAGPQQSMAAIAAHGRLVTLGTSGRIDPSMAAMIGFEIGTILASLAHQPATSTVS